jgi:alpha-1,2-mannosyltransferase
MRYAALIGLVLIAAFNLTGLLAWTSRGDLATFAAAGAAWTEGSNPYAIPGRDQNLLTPLWLPALGLLAHADLAETARLWRLASGVLYLMATAILLRRSAYPSSPLRLAWILAFAGLWYTLLFAQIYVVILWLVALAWLTLDRGRDVLAGLCIGLLIALKPNFALWPVLLFVAGHRRVSAIALGAGIGLSAVPLVAYGPGVYVDWLRALAANATLAYFPLNASVFGVAARLGVSWLSWPLAVGMVLSVAWILWCSRPRPLETSAVALTVTLLISPLAWVGYSVALLPALLWRPWTRLLALAAGLFVVPLPAVMVGFGAPATVQLTIGSLYCYALVMALAAWLPLVATRAGPVDRSLPAL